MVYHSSCICLTEPSQAPKNINFPSHAPKVIPKALVPPILRPKTTQRPLPPPPPEPEPKDNEYVVPIDKPDDQELKGENEFHIKVQISE